MHKQLNEARGGHLYHGTTLPRAVSALSANTLIAYTRTHSKHVTNKRYDDKAVSFSRSLYKAKEFARSDYREIPGVIFVVDQAKLHQLVGNRLQAYDDTNTEWYRSQLKRYGNDFADDPRSGRSSGRNEAEEVVFGDIKGFDRVVDKIIVLISSYDEEAHLAEFDKSPLANDRRVVLFDAWKMVPYVPKSEQKKGVVDYYKKLPSEFAIKRSINQAKSESVTHKQTFLEFLSENSLSWELRSPSS